MSRHAFIVGGSGQIGRAVAKRLLDDGRTVTVASRGERPIAGLEAARHWLTAKKDQDWKALYPVMASYPHDPFDYAAEDAALKSS